MQLLALPVPSEPAEAILSNYPEGAAGEDWESDEETLRSYAVSTCANGWGLVYSQMFEGLGCEGGTSWQQPQR